ncbi:MAG TPA: formate hydrogenlyase regulator HycA, partial [Enterobacter roggenkampii]|nr:formate hydrogenlyase regulator HycA [Enterobacter roggenkampii]
MTIWEISEKAEYIAQRHQQLQDQWHLYCNSLVQGITLSKARLHHAMSCAAQGDMRFVLFGHFIINVTLADNFNSHTIEYHLETKDGEKQCIAKAQLMADGMVDGHVSNRDRRGSPAVTRTVDEPRIDGIRRPDGSRHADRP